MSQIAALHQAFQWKGRRWVVQSIRLKYGKAQLTCDDGDVDTLSIDDFRDRIATGEMERLTTDRDGKEQVANNGWRALEGNTARLERERREFILAQLKDRQRQGHSHKQALDSLGLICKTWDEKHPGTAKEGSVKQCRVPKPRTIRRWQALARGHQSAMSPQWHRCGNSQQGATPELKRAMEEVISSTYLQNDLLTVTMLWEYVKARYRQICEELQIAPQSRSIKVLNKFLRNFNWTEEKFQRLPSRIARSITRTAVEVHWADYAWEQVQVDATSLDILVCDENGVEVGRPTLYVAIDTATGYIVGIYLTILKPSAMAFVELLRFMYYKKPADFDQKYGILYRLEAFGKPVGMSVDQGNDFTSAEAIEVVRVLHGDTVRCQPYTPQEKPHIERFFGVLKDYVRTLPGSTKSAVQTKKPRVPPKSEKLLTIEDLQGRIYRFVYDDYCLRINDMRSHRRGKPLSPRSLWKEHSEQYWPPFPVPIEEFEISLYFKKTVRVLQAYGIDFETYTYNSEELAELFRRVGRIEVEILYSELDAVRIHVKDPQDEHVIIVASSKELEGQCVDRKTAKENRERLAEGKKAAEDARQPNLCGRLAEATQDNINTNSKTSQGRAKQARAKELARQARELAAKQAAVPSVPAQPPQSSTGRKEYQFDLEAIKGRERGDRKA